MIALVQHVWEAVGLAGFAAIWAVKALFGLGVLRALRPRWQRLTGRRRQGT